MNAESTITNSNIKSSDILPKDWHTADESLTADDVINAYFKGKEDGAREHFEKFKQEFLVNLKLASSISEELYSNAVDKQISIAGVYLKALNIDSFDVLFLVSEQIFESGQISKAYLLSRNMKQKYLSNRIKVNFSFTENSDDLSTSCLAADGYLVRYGQKAKA